MNKLKKDLASNPNWRSIRMCKYCKQELKPIPPLDYVRSDRMFCNRKCCDNFSLGRNPDKPVRDYKRRRFFIK